MINTAVQDPWLVLYVKRQTEKKVTERLQALGITVYLPTITVVRQWSDRKKKLQIPAVSGVVFVQCTGLEKNQAFSVPGTVRYLFMAGQLAQVPHKEIVAGTDCRTPDVPRLVAGVAQGASDFKASRIAPHNRTPSAGMVASEC